MGGKIMQMLTDNPIHRTNEDRFGFAPYAHILANVIRDTERLPFCIGIFGPWGTGKSSLMRMIDEIISSYDNTKSVWFNPWKYDQKEDLWHALIQTILYKIVEDAPKDVVKKAKSLATHTAWTILKKGVSNLTAGLISGRDLDKLRKVITSQDELFHRHINNFEGDFAKVIKLYTNGGKLIVFIDDLDRCIPENAITVLEALKLFVGDSECVFVLGMDHFIVEEGIKRRYGRHVKMSGRDYIDKIVQVPFYLPPVPFDKLREALSVAKTTNYTETVWRSP